MDGVEYLELRSYPFGIHHVGTGYVGHLFDLIGGRLADERKDLRDDNNLMVLCAASEMPVELVAVDHYHEVVGGQSVLVCCRCFRGETDAVNQRYEAVWSDPSYAPYVEKLASRYD